MNRLQPIANADDPRISGYRNIRERDLRRRDGLCVAEGTVVLDALLRSSRFAPVSLLLLRNRVAGLEGLIERVPSGVPIYAAERDVMDAIVGFPIHRGVLALARAATDSAIDLATIAADRILIACGIANHDNAGGLLRVAAAFGAGAVLFDEGSADPLYRKSIRVSAGAAFTVPHTREGSIDDLLDRAAVAGWDLVALSPTGATDIGDRTFGGRTALVVGAEGPGLPATILERMPTARIPMAAGHDSLNVAVSAAVALYALGR